MFSSGKLSAQEQGWEGKCWSANCKYGLIGTQPGLFPCWLQRATLKMQRQDGGLWQTTYASQNWKCLLSGPLQTSSLTLGIEMLFSSAVYWLGAHSRPWEIPNTNGKRGRSPPEGVNKGRHRREPGKTIRLWLKRCVYQRQDSSQFSHLHES